MLQDISSKLEVISLTLKDFVEIYKSERSKTADVIVCLEENIKGLSDQVMQNRNGDTEISAEPHRPENAVQAIRQQLWRIWRKSLNERKMAFWNHTRSINLAVVYDLWLGIEQPILPRKFRPMKIAGEAIEDTEIRRDTALRNFEAEVKLLKNKSR